MAHRSLLALILAAASACTTTSEPDGARWAREWKDRLEGRPQRHNLSCEARAACDLLRAHGVEVAEERFLSALPRSDDPERGFVGDVDGPGGRVPPEAYGVHAPPVAATIGSFGLPARAERGRDLAWLLGEVSSGRPVVAWITYDCRPGRRMEVALGEGRSAWAVRWEHAVLVVGARGNRIVYVDPAWGEERDADMAEFDAAWALFDREAVSAPAAVPLR